MGIQPRSPLDADVASAKARLLAVGEEPLDPPLWPLFAAMAAGGALGCFARDRSRSRSGSPAPQGPGGASGLLELVTRLAADLLSRGPSGRADRPS
jgi:hypothetical protein